MRDWRIEGTLEHKVQTWKEESQNLARCRRETWTGDENDAVEIDEEIVDESLEESESDEDDIVQAKAPKVVSSQPQPTRWLFRVDAGT